MSLFFIIQKKNIYIYIQIIVCTAVSLLIYDVIGAGRLRPTSFHLEMYS